MLESEINIIVFLQNEEDNPDLVEPFVISVNKLEAFPLLQQALIRKVQDPKPSINGIYLYNGDVALSDIEEDSEVLREAIEDARINLPATVHGNITIWWR